MWLNRHFFFITMSRLNNQDYVEVMSGSNQNSSSKKSRTYRNWWLVKDGDFCGYISINMIRFKKHHIGKRVKIKVEFLEE